MADIAGVAFSIAQPIVNSGVNQLREPENQESAEELRATSAPQRDQPVNSEPTDVPAEQSVSSRLDFSVPTAENTTEENTTEINEQVVLAAEQQIQQTSVEANARRSEAVDQNEIEAATQQTANQATNQTNDDLATNNNPAPPQQSANVETTVEATNTTEASTDQDFAVNAPQNNPPAEAQVSQSTDETTSEDAETGQSQATTEQFESRNPETGLGLNSGSIINVTA